MSLSAGSSSCVAIRVLVGASLALGPLVVAAVASAGVASAQGGVAETITEAEIEQRLNVDRLSTHREPSREDVIEELRAEKRKLLSAQLAGIEVTDSAVDAAYAGMARRMNLTEEQLTAALAHAGVDSSTLKYRIRVDLAWRQYVRSGIPSLNKGPSRR